MAPVGRFRQLFSFKIPLHHGIHWLAPGSMLGSLLAGILLAMGHHLFYQRLDGTVANTAGILGSDISRQQASIAVGTAFAFLVKASLVYAVTIAYIQIFWKEAKAPNAAPTLSTLDDLSCAVDNLLVLFKPSAWISYWLLLLLATVVWLLPVASIITPATLSTRIAPLSPAEREMRNVPNLDFRSLAFVEDLRITFPSVYVYAGPNHPVSDIASATMSNGAILPILPLASNSSWEVDFFGPAIKCDSVEGTMRLGFRQNIFTYLTGGRKAYGGNTFTLYGYMGWFPELGSFSTGVQTNQLGLYSPFYRANGSADVHFTTGELYHTFYLFAASPAMANAYVTQVSGSDLWQTGLENASIDSLPEWLDGTMLECRLLNSSYNALFNYSDGLQQITVKDSILEQQGPIDLPFSVIGPGFASNETGIEYKTCLKLSRGVHGSGACLFDEQLLSVLSYQAVWDSFTSVLKGTVYYETTNRRIRNSSVVDTALANTPELSILRGIEGDPSAAGASLKTALALYDDPAVQGLEVAYNATTQMPLSDALEEMFRNVTVSLMSSPALQPNNSSLTAPGPVPVTFPSNELIYTYTPWKLWLPYGIAIILASAAVTLGFVTLAHNRASYSDDFSTIFRAARGAGLSAQIAPADLHGHDPLPDYLEEAWVTLRKRSSGDAAKVTVQYAPVALDAPLNIAPNVVRPEQRGHGDGLQRSTTRMTM